MDSNKNIRAERARKHTEDMAKRYAGRIHESSLKTEEFDGDAVPGIYNADLITDDKHKPGTVFVKADSVSALFKYREGRTAVLDFASFTRPGGGFTEGSMAQEEALCHSSTLYNVLQRKEGFYTANTMRCNGGLYADRALYVPEVVFEGANGRTCMADVITCAAPNRTVTVQAGIPEGANHHALISRIRFVLNVAMSEGVETLVLGAFGCGVFGQDAVTVGSIFAMLLGNDCGNFRRVIFAVPDDANFNALKKGYGYTAKNAKLRLVPAGANDAGCLAALMRECGSKSSDEELEDAARKCMGLSGIMFRDGTCGAVYIIRRTDTQDALGLIQAFYDGKHRAGELRFIGMRKEYRHRGLGTLAVKGLAQLHPEISQWDCMFPESAAGIKRFLYGCGFKFCGKDTLGDFVFTLDMSVRQTAEQKGAA